MQGWSTEGDKNLSACSLRLEDSSWRSLLQKEILRKKAEKQLLCGFGSRQSLMSVINKGNSFDRWHGMMWLSCHHAELKSHMIWLMWSNECFFHLTAASLKASSPRLWGECRILLLIITDYYISCASHRRPAWKDMHPQGAAARTWIPKRPWKGCMMVSAGSVWNTSKPWLLFFSAKSH